MGRSTRGAAAAAVGGGQLGVIAGDPRRRPRAHARAEGSVAAMAVLVALIAAAFGYFGVRAIAHLENGVPIAAGRAAVVNVDGATCGTCCRRNAAN